MHELSIAYALLEQMEIVLLDHPSAAAVSVTVVLGAFSGVDPQAFKHCFEQAKRVTRFTDTSLFVQPIRPQTSCRSCLGVCDIDGIAIECPLCKSSDIEMIGTHEITLKSMEVT